jgi:hypothetical protein
MHKCLKLGVTLFGFEDYLNPLAHSSSSTHENSAKETNFVFLVVSWEIKMKFVISTHIFYFPDSENIEKTKIHKKYWW